MIGFLMLAHVALLILSIIMDRRTGVNRLRSLVLPVGFSFVYTSVVQAGAAVQNLGYGLDQNNIATALWASLMSYLAVLLAYRFAPDNGRRSSFARKNIVPLRLNSFGMFFFVAGLIGYYLSMQAVGGWRALLNMEDWTGNLYDISGYIYMLRYACYAAVALWLMSLSLHVLPPLLHGLLILLMLWLLFEAVQMTDRGDTIRASLPIVAWFYIVTRRYRYRIEYRLLGNLVIASMLLFVGLAGILLPEFRDVDRSMLRSDTTLAVALERSRAKNASSRASEGGGEFDTGARIIKRVNAGEINPPGPVHIGRLIWNIVPRALVPNKHEIYEAWAGKNYMEVRYGCISYMGCSSTGWGEAYGMMGWFGAILYWALFGFGIRRFEYWFGESAVGLIVSAICYLPLVQFVVQDFWAGGMNTSIVVLPVLVILKLSQRTGVGGENSLRTAQTRRKQKPTAIRNLAS